MFALTIDYTKGGLTIFTFPFVFSNSNGPKDNCDLTTGLLGGTLHKQLLLQEKIAS
jgi:hypothetical protein